MGDKEGREGKEKREESCSEEGRGASLLSGLKMDLPFFSSHVQSLTNFFSFEILLVLSSLS